jgi:hypothetical protein
MLTQLTNYHTMGSQDMTAKEEDYYPSMKQKILELFESKGCKAHLKITAYKKFSNKLKSKIPDHRQFIFY